MDIRPINSTFGIEVRDLVLRRAATAEWDRLRDALGRAGLVVLRRQSLSDADLMEAAEGLASVGAKGAVRRDGVAVISDLTDQRGRALGDQRLLSMDWSSEAVAAPQGRFRLLYAVETPITGGALHFCDLDAALASLSPEMCRRAEAARIECPARGLGWLLRGGHRARGAVPMLHDAPGGTRRLRLPAEGERIAGMKPEAARVFLSGLLAALVVETRCIAHAWGPGDVLIWDRARVLRRQDPSTGVHFMKTVCFD